MDVRVILLLKQPASSEAKTDTAMPAFISHPLVLKPHRTEYAVSCEQSRATSPNAPSEMSSFISDGKFVVKVRALAEQLLCTL